MRAASWLAHHCQEGGQAAAAFGYLLCFEGMGFRLWPAHPVWNAHAQLFFIYLMMGAGSLFARDFLDTGASRLADRARVVDRASAAQDNPEPVTQDGPAGKVCDAADSGRAGIGLALEREHRHPVGELPDPALDGSAVVDAAAADQTHAVVGIADD